MRPKHFLIYGGALLLILGAVGFIGVIGPKAETSIFKEVWYFDYAENWAHIVIGALALLLGFLVPARIQKPIAVLLGLMAIAVGVYSIFIPQFFSATFQNPIDITFNMLIGIWAIFTVILGTKEQAIQKPSKK